MVGPCSGNRYPRRKKTPRGPSSPGFARLAAVQVAGAVSGAALSRSAAPECRRLLAEAAAEHAVEVRNLGKARRPRNVLDLHRRKAPVEQLLARSDKAPLDDIVGEGDPGLLEEPLDIALGYPEPSRRVPGIECGLAEGLLDEALDGGETGRLD